MEELHILGKTERETKVSKLEEMRDDMERRGLQQGVVQRVGLGIDRKIKKFKGTSWTTNS